MANPRKVNENGEVFIEVNSVDDVIQLKENPGSLFMSSFMFKFSQLIRSIECKLLGFDSRYWNESSYQAQKKWINEGVECELLELASPSWKKGKVKVKVTLEFYPDEPENIQSESPLDEIRKTINS
jgi:KGK domain